MNGSVVKVGDDINKRPKQHKDVEFFPRIFGKESFYISGSTEKKGKEDEFGKLEFVSKLRDIP
jgi:hypothetical protein